MHLRCTQGHEDVLRLWGLGIGIRIGIGIGLDSDSDTDPDPESFLIVVVSFRSRFLGEAVQTGMDARHATRGLRRHTR
jgi:hypothetical protein